jgi:hypothetical protein
MNNVWLEQIVSNPELMSMGHGQRAEDKNLGMGWMYYALARMYRPATVVCIGSWRGFVPMMFARGMQDNAQAGTVHFVDPGMVDDHWQSPESVSEWFDHHDVNNITHHKKTTQQFVETNIYRNLHWLCKKVYCNIYFTANNILQYHNWTAIFLLLFLKF